MSKKYISTCTIQSVVLENVKDYKDIGLDISTLMRVLLAIPKPIFYGEDFEEAVLNVKVVPASVVLLAEVFDESHIKNIVSLTVNNDIVFEDKHDIDNDLPLMLEAIEDLDIDRLDSAVIVMESIVHHDVYTYTVNISKLEDDSVEFSLDVVDPNTENDGDYEEEAFQNEIELLKNNLEKKGIKIKEESFS
ncbi:MAG: hypothetical protein U9Q66_03185 [Patescibacteria group bacterium]|nr:hypothetical protein [Patescibacteria group bacterium]